MATATVTVTISLDDDDATQDNRRTLRRALNDATNLAPVLLCTLVKHGDSSRRLIKDVNGNTIGEWHLVRNNSHRFLGGE